MVIQRNRPWLVAGSPGSERILSSVVQFLNRVGDGSLPICGAMHCPRLHYPPEGILSIESGRYNRRVVDYLRKKVTDISHRQDYSFYLGAIHSVVHCTTKDEFQGAAEVRRDGIAAGVTLHKKSHSEE